MLYPFYRGSVVMAPIVALPPDLELALGRTLVRRTHPAGESGLLPRSGSRSYLRATRQGLYKELASAPRGARYRTLNWAAYRLASLGDREADAWRVLGHAARRCGLSEREFESTFDSGWRAASALLKYPKSLSDNKTRVIA